LGSRFVLSVLVIVTITANLFVVGPTATVLAAPPSSPVTVSSSNQDGHRDMWPDVGESPDGSRLVAAWRTDRANGGNDSEVKVAVSTNEGNSWSGEFQLFKGSSGSYLETVRVAYDATGAVHVVFMSGLGDNRKVYHFVAPAGTDPAQPSSWLSQASACNSCVNPDMWVDGAGYAYISYESTNNFIGIVRTFGSTGTWSGTQRVTTGGRIYGSIGVDSNGKIHVVIADKNTRITHYDRYTSFGNFTRERREVLESSGVGHRPDLAVDSANRVHVIYGRSGEVYYREIVGDSISSGLRLNSSTVQGDPGVTIAASGSNDVYAAWQDRNFQEIWENRRIGGSWTGSQLISSSDGSAQYVQYGDSLLGSVNMMFAERISNVHQTRFYHRAAGSRDEQGPNVTFFDVSPPAGVQQRATGTVSGTDTAQSGTPSGIARIEYSLNGVNWVTASRNGGPPFTGNPGSISNVQFDVDLTNPGAGGGWGNNSHNVRVRLVDARGNVGVLNGDTISHNVPSASRTEFLAEGYTGGTFDEYLTLINPSGATIAVSVEFMYAGTSSGTPGTTVVIGPNKRETLFVDEAAGIGKELSLRLQSNAMFYAERPMYFRNYPAASATAQVENEARAAEALAGGGNAEPLSRDTWTKLRPAFEKAGTAYNRPGISALSGINGGHVGASTVTAATTWSFAEGTTRDGFETYFTIQNPTADDATVTINYYYPNGGDTKLVMVGAGQRKTVVVHGNGEGSIGTNKDFASRLTSTRNIIVERVMYFRYANGFVATGGTATLGVQNASDNWYFAEGYTGLNFHQYVALFNPHGTPVGVDFVYYIEGQAQEEIRTCQIPATSRMTVLVHAPASPDNPCGLGPDKANSLWVHASEPIYAERPMYFLYGAPGLTGVDGGHNVMGAITRTPTGQTVYMAEGYTGAGFHQYLSIQNPNTTTATVQITYLKADGTTAGPFSVGISPKQRRTIAVHNPADPSGAGIGPNQAFGTRVHVANGGAAGIVVERMMYFNYGAGATGGTAAFGKPAP
jgi:hypothetical protein